MTSCSVFWRLISDSAGRVPNASIVLVMAAVRFQPNASGQSRNGNSISRTEFLNFSPRGQGIGAGISVLGLVLARRRGDENALLWLGLLAFSLWFGTLLCLALKVLRFAEARKRRNIDIRPGRIRTDAEYVAEYSGRDRGTAIALALFFGMLTAFLALRSTMVQSFPGLYSVGPLGT